MVDCIGAIMYILKKYGVCTHREICDRVHSKFSYKKSTISHSLEFLSNKSKLSKKSLRNTYNTYSSFYYIPDNISDVKRNELIDYKLGLVNQQADYNNEIAIFGENLVAKVLENLGYTEIETRKTKNDDIGLGRSSLDVWGLHPSGAYYHHIEVKNRKQSVGFDDIDNIERKTDLALKWGLPIKSGLVCTFIYPTILPYAITKDIPVVITSRQFVPYELAEFYDELKNSFGSYYIESACLDNPPEGLIELIRTRLVEHQHC